jgi:hypothetical protein
MSQQQKLLFFKGVPLLLTLLAGIYMLLILVNSYSTNFSESSNNNSINHNKVVSKREELKNIDTVLKKMKKSVSLFFIFTISFFINSFFLKIFNFV